MNDDVNCGVSDQTERKVRSFDSFCRILLKNEIKDIYRTKNRSRGRESLFSELSPLDMASLQTDPYEYQTVTEFEYNGWVIRVVDEDLAVALTFLNPSDRTIVLLAYFLDMTDKDIGAVMCMPRSTVQYRRKRTLKILKKILTEQ